MERHRSLVLSDADASKATAGVGFAAFGEMPGDRCSNLHHLKGVRIGAERFCSGLKRSQKSTDSAATITSFSWAEFRRGRL